MRRCFGCRRASSLGKAWPGAWLSICCSSFVLFACLVYGRAGARVDQVGDTIGLQKRAMFWGGLCYKTKADWARGEEGKGREKKKTKTKTKKKPIRILAVRTKRGRFHRAILLTDPRIVFGA